MIQMNLPTKHKHTSRNRTVWLPQGKGGGGGIN